jgi:prolipoprotein diacylglyceryltransferase
MENVLFTAGIFNITAYGLCMAAVAALCVAAAYFYMRRLGNGVWEIFAVWCLPLALIGARLFYCLARMNYIADLYGPGFILRLWEGGYAFWGAAGGCALAALVCARRTGLRAGTILDAAAPALMLALALCRFAEYFSGQGFGLLVENETLCFFPLAVQNAYGEWYFAVFMGEGITALLACLLAARRFKAHKALKSVLLIAAAQIVWESIRRDDFLRWGFVRVSQLTAVLTLFAILTVMCVRRLRGGEKLSRTVIRIAVFLLLAVACVALEFAMDKTPFPYG